MANIPTSMTANATRRNCPERLLLFRGFASDDASNLTSAYTATIPHPWTVAFLYDVRI
jgi:hypothetical protein